MGNIVSFKNIFDFSSFGTSESFYDLSSEF